MTLDFHLFGPGNHRPQWCPSREINFLLQHEARIPTSTLGSSSSEWGRPPTRAQREELDIRKVVEYPDSKV